MTKKLLVYTIKTAFDAMDASHVQGAMEVLEQLQQYGAAKLMEVELVEGEMETWQHEKG